MSEYTPGPWVANGPEDEIGEAVCAISGGWCVIALEENPEEYQPEADARLIAAAPRMKNALERIHQMSLQDLDSEDLLELIRIESVTALQEAKGEHK